MRPPQNAGEDDAPFVGGLLSLEGFNEAPAERGGRPVDIVKGVMTKSGLQ